MRIRKTSRSAAWWTGRALILVLLGAAGGAQAQSAASSEQPLLDLFVKKGFVTQEEADQVKAEAEASQTNALVQAEESRWKLTKGTSRVELYGDIRTRYENREAFDPAGDKIDEERFRYAIRFGLRGDMSDHFYYGLRLETAANPRSPWVTFSSSTTGVPYQGPFGKSTSGLGVGQAYLGWKPASWLDITVGKMANLLYTTPMVWDSDIDPEGAVERLKYPVGPAEFFGNFAQYFYDDPTPTTASPGLLTLGGVPTSANNVFMTVWQAGLTYQFTPKISAKIAGTLYQYYGLTRSSEANSQNPAYQFFGDPYVGEGAYTGPGSGNPVNGYAGYGTSSGLPGYQSVGYPNNQVGLNHLLVLEVPFEVNFEFSKVHTRFFGDVAYNLEGDQRAEDAAQAYAVYLANQPAGQTATINGFTPQEGDRTAYQVGFGIGSTNVVYGPTQGVVYGTSTDKHAWEFRTYWQHIEQYSLDPNLVDSDFFEGRENMQGLYAAIAYSLSDNFTVSARYGYADRINGKLGTGGSNQDIPWMNPIKHYDLFQLDLALRF